MIWPSLFEYNVCCISTFQSLTYPDYGYRLKALIQCGSVMLTFSQASANFFESSGLDEL